jgi:hypothetical protein
MRPVALIISNTTFINTQMRRRFIINPIRKSLTEGSTRRLFIYRKRS